jgi:hypothetical protein
MVKRRLFSVALMAALLMSLGLASTSRAADDSVTVTGSVADVLTLTLNYESVTFGTDLNFLGQNAAVGACDLSPGARYLSPNVTATVQSNKAFDIERTPAGNFPAGRILVESGGWVDCASALTNAVAVDPGTDTVVSNEPASASFAYTDIFYFDVLVDSPAASYNATISYTLVALP